MFHLALDRSNESGLHGRLSGQSVIETGLRLGVYGDGLVNYLTFRDRTLILAFNKLGQDSYHPKNRFIALD